MLDLEYREYLENSFNIFNVEDYGAVPLDPANPKAAPDATDAVQECILDAWSRSKHPIIFIPNMYRLAKDPSQFINGVHHFCQLYIPLTEYNATTQPYRTITFRFGSSGSFEAQSIVSMPTPYNGSGFYSSWIEYIDREASMLGMERPQSSVPIWGEFSYTTVNFEGSGKFIAESIENGVDRVTYLSAIDLSKAAQCSFDRLYCRTSSMPMNTVETSQTSFGLRLPANKNHAVCTGNTLYTAGFGNGLVGAEHMAINYVLALGNYFGIYMTTFYPGWIGNYCSENNKINIKMQDNSYLHIGAWNGENYDGLYIGAKWYTNQYDVLGSGASCHLSVGQFVVHKPGGATVQLVKSNANIDVKMMSNEQGASELPLRTTDNAVNPLNEYTLRWNKNTSALQIWISGAWVNV